MINLYLDSSEKRAQVHKIRTGKRVTTDITNIQRIIKGYCKQLYANKIDNLEEMDKFLERCNLPRFNQEEIENINRLTSSTDIETVILKFPTNKNSGLDGFTGEFYQTFRAELTPVLLKLVQKKM